MERYPQVDVKEITAEEVEQLTSDTPPIGINLGGAHDLVAALNEGVVEQLRTAIRDKASRVFLLTWEGNKVPRGVSILGHIIAWTQHGRVISEGGQEIGMYDRLVEFGGESGHQQQMIVYATVA